MTRTSSEPRPSGSAHPRGLFVSENSGTGSRGFHVAQPPSAVCRAILPRISMIHPIRVHPCPKNKKGFSRRGAESAEKIHTSAGHFAFGGLFFPFIPHPFFKVGGTLHAETSGDFTTEKRITCSQRLSWSDANGVPHQSLGLAHRDYPRFARKSSITTSTRLRIDRAKFRNPGWGCGRARKPLAHGSLALLGNHGLCFGTPLASDRTPRAKDRIVSGRGGPKCVERSRA